MTPRSDSLYRFKGSPSHPSDDRCQSRGRWEQLLALIEGERLYLDTQLMQQQIADRLSVSCRTLSRLISDRSAHNFNNFVNGYRLREAKQLLRDPGYARLSVEVIAKKAGFNSRGVFYRFFKEETGMSPAAYRDHK